MRNDLWQATQCEHQRIESLPINRTLLANPEPGTYAKILEAWMKSYQALGTLLPEEHLARVSDLSENLQKDLNQFGTKFLSQVWEPIKQPFAVNSWGILYVLLGATLGGQVISTRLAKSSYEIIRCNRRFFRGFGKDTRLHWESFCKELSTLDLSKRQRKNAVISAKYAFETIERNLSAIG